VSADNTIVDREVPTGRTSVRTLALMDDTTQATVARSPAAIKTRPVGSVAEADTEIKASDGLEDALSRVESMRTRTMATFGVIACTAVTAGILLINRDWTATLVHLTGLGIAGLVSAYCWWRLRGKRVEEPQPPCLAIALGVSCAIAAMSGFYYWGVFSGVVVVVPIGAFLLGQSRSPRGSWLIAAFFLLGHLATAVCIMTGIVEDRSFNPVGDRPWLVQALRVATTQTIMIATFWVARRLRLTARENLLKLDAAMRALAQRDALLAEAARERDEVRQINVPGRYTGKQIGNYELGHVIGRGAMGIVYEALDKATGKNVAIKVLHPHVLADPEQFRRFCQELRIASSIDNPFVVKVYYTPVDDQLFPFMAMERLRGQSLADYLSENPSLSIREILDMLAQIGSGLQAAHASGIVHRDLKPRNLFRLDPPEGEVRWKILDFGTSKLMDQADATLTEFGHVIGTPAYMAPEQARGARVDYRADLYALALVVYRCLTGRPAFSHRNVPELLYQVVHEMPPRPSQLRQLSTDVDRVFAIALAKRPYERFSSVQEFYLALEAAIEGRLPPELREVAEALTARNPWGQIPGYAGAV
jgi:tRNA A-37 threonylcarbamoyl transferase component Bud32